MNFSTKCSLLLFLIVLSAFFAFSEISLAATRKTKLKRRIDEGDASAKEILAMKEHPAKYFSVVQIGINMVAILGGIVGEGAFTPYFSELFAMVMSETYAEKFGFCLSFLLVTLGFVLFADLIPKRLALQYPEKVAAFCLRPMGSLIVLLSPLVWLLEKLSNGLMKLMGLQTDRKEKITSEDIMATVNAGANEGVILPEEQAVIENVFNLENNSVTAAMTARESIVYFELDANLQEVQKVLAESPHNNFLVCDKTVDQVVGYVECGTLLRHILEGKKFSLKDPGLLRSVQMVPDTLSLSELLELFQKTRTDFAVVLNEYALVVGVITLNDVMSSVMGDFVLTPEESQIVKRDDTSWLVDGATPIVDMMRELEWDDMPESQSYETMAGFMMYMLRRIPKRTDKIDWNGYRFEVVNVEANRIDQILVSRLSKTQK